MNRNEVFAAIRNFERANKEHRNSLRRLHNHIMNERLPAGNLEHRLSLGKRPMTRQNNLALKFARRRTSAANNRQAQLLAAHENIENRRRNAYQRLSRAMRGFVTLLPGWQLHGTNLTQVRHAIRTVRGLQKTQNIRRVAPFAQKWLNKAKQRKVRSAYTGATRSGIPSNIAKNISRRAFN